MAANVYALQLSGKDRTEALTRFQAQLDVWGMTMPPSDPLVMDFGGDEFYKTGLIEHWIANELDEGYCGKYLFVFDGQTCPMHCHHVKHETFFVARGCVKMIVDGKERELSAGDVLVMPPNILHSFTGIGNAMLLEVSKPCQAMDNFFADPRVNEWMNAVG